MRWADWLYASKGGPDAQFMRGFRFRSQTLQTQCDGVVAQLAERLVRNEKVAGSIPVGSTIFQVSICVSVHRGFIWAVHRLTPFGLVAFLTLLLPGSLLAHGPGEEMAEAANAFLKSLTPEQRAKATFDFQDPERAHWHFVPQDRKGLPWKEMTVPQRRLAQGLLASALSETGYRKSTNIMALESVLHDLEGAARRLPRDPELYYLSVFGDPTGATNTWGWRVEGHHLSVNLTVIEGHEVAVTPSFMGTNPAEVRSGPQRGLRILAAEEDLARQLLNSLTEPQRQTAIIANQAPSDIITGNSRRAKALEPVGLTAAQMTREQTILLEQLVSEYVGRYRKELASSDLAKIKQAGWDKVQFAWAGGAERGKGHYYRVQGPTFLLEYDNTQNDANHIHSVWRDFENDFGDDLLRRHYEQSPHGQGVKH